MEKSLYFKNTKVSFTDSGKGPVVVLLHGFLENKTMWKNLIPQISSRNRVLAIDLLGHGKTDCLGYVHSMEMMAETIYFVLKTLKIRKITLIGHSMGGYVSLAFAEKKPTMIRGLCLLNSSSKEDDSERKKIRTRAIQLVKKDFRAMIRMSFMNLFGEKNSALFKTEVNLALEEALKTPMQGYIACQEGMKNRPKRTNVLHQNHFKKLFIAGEQDPILPIKQATKEAKTTNSKIVILSGGHMSHIENKTRLMSALNAFIKDSLKK